MSQQQNAVRAFATTSPGLEPALASELSELGCRNVKKMRAGVGFDTDRHGLERATMSLRTAHRVLWTIGDVRAHDAASLYRSTRALARWHGLVPPDKTLAVFATCRDTPAFSDARFVALKVKDAIVDTVRETTGARPDVSVSDPDVVVRVSVARGRGVVSLDAAGKISLHARGYRLSAGAAPLRETLAAGILKLAGWDGAEPLVDPLTGSATIVIEAALAARGIVPGLARERYGFMRWPGFKSKRREAFVAEARARIAPSTKGPILGIERDRSLLGIAADNVRRAGVADDVRLLGGDGAAWDGELPSGGLIVTNPPWGERMGDRVATQELLAALAAHWRRRGRWRAAVLVPDTRAAEALALADARTISLDAGGRKVLLAMGRLAPRAEAGR